MKKKYLVNLSTNKYGCMLTVRSIKLARWLMNLKCWKYAKIHDMETKLCIDFVKR